MNRREVVLSFLTRKKDTGFHSDFFFLILIERMETEGEFQVDSIVLVVEGKVTC